MHNLKKVFWFILGLIFLAIAYVGVVTPGIPWSTPVVIAAFCFGKSSERWHNYLMNHKRFGAFLRNWSQKRIFPKNGKLAMSATMGISLIIMLLTLPDWKKVLLIAFFMLACLVWAWRFPETVEEWERRHSLGQKIGWFK